MSGNNSSARTGPAPIPGAAEILAPAKPGEYSCEQQAYPNRFSNMELFLKRLALVLRAADVYLFSVAAGVPPAVEPGILPGGLSCGLRRHLRVQSSDSGRQDGALYGSQDGCRYSRKATLSTYTDVVGGAGEAER